MATTVSYGSITLIDTTDIGEFSIYPKCNLPLSVVYNPDQTGSTAFTPNWDDTNLIITPSIWYAGNMLNTTTSGLTLTWSKQVGVGSVKPLDAEGEDVSDGTLVVNGETIPKGTLVVSQNKFSNVDTTPMITYIVTATYYEPTSLQTLTAQGEITFSLVKQASSVKSITINGDSVFKYDENGKIEGVSTITLNARYTNVRLSGWEYLDGTTWKPYPNSTTTPSLTVSETDAVFFNNKAVIRLIAASPDTEIYDMHVITKLHDGRVGAGTTTAVLTNEDEMIPFIKDVDGTEKGVYTSAESQIIIYRGGDGDVTSEYNITQTYDNVEATAQKKTVDNDYVKVTKINGQVGKVTFTAKLRKDGDSAVPIIKTFNLVRVDRGADGDSPVLYSVTPSAFALSKLKTNEFNPATVTFNCWEQTGNEKKPYKGMLRVYENVTPSEITSSTIPKHESGQGEESYTYTPTKDATSILCMMYENGAFTNLLDTQTVAVAMQGEKGEDGKEGVAGENSFNVTLTNYYSGITTNPDFTLPTVLPITIGFCGYDGTQKVDTDIRGANNLTLFGYNPSEYEAATPTKDGHITFTLPKGADLSGYSKNGNITLVFDLYYNDSEKLKTVTYDYPWGIVPNPRDGINSVYVQLGTPEGGNVIENGVGEVKIHANVIDGGTEVTSSCTFEWCEFEDGEYKPISGQTGSVLTVTPDMVDSYSSFKCIATYSGKPYVQYMTVLDKSDPVQTTVLSSVGDKLLNGRGVGALYVKVFRNGQELDPVKSERFVETLPNTGSEKQGDLIYLLDTVKKTVVLYKYTSKWEEATSASESASTYVPPYKGTYEWFYRNKDGVIIHNGDSDGDGGTIRTPASTGKVVYVDGDLVDKKLIADVRVTI